MSVSINVQISPSQVFSELIEEGHIVMNDLVEELCMDMTHTVSNLTTTNKKQILQLAKKINK